MRPLQADVQLGKQALQDAGQVVTGRAAIPGSGLSRADDGEARASTDTKSSAGC